MKSILGMSLVPSSLTFILTFPEYIYTSTSAGSPSLQYSSFIYRASCMFARMIGIPESTAFRSILGKSAWQLGNYLNYELGTQSGGR